MNAIKAWIFKGLKENDRWMHAHPYHACLDAGFAVFIGTFIGYFERWQTSVIGLSVLVAYLIPSAIVQHRQCKKLTAAAMAVLIGLLSVSNGHGQALLPDLPQEPGAFPPGLIEQIPQGELDAAATTQCYVIALIIVTIFAVWVAITLKRLNDKIPPPPPPEEEGHNEDSDAGYFVTVTEEERREFTYCNMLTAASATVSTVVELDLAIEATDLGPAARLRVGKTYTDSTGLTDNDGLKEPLAKWGLDFDPNVKGPQYAHNGQRVNPWESPIGFHANERGRIIPTISNGGTPYPLILEQSEDLQIWQFLFEVRIEAGRTIRLTDTSPTRQRFYRLRVGR